MIRQLTWLPKDSEKGDTMTAAKTIILGVVALGLAGCASKTVYTKPGKVSRHDAAVDVLDCRKAAVIAHKQAISGKPNTPEVMQNAAAKARIAEDRCLRGHGWQRKS